jgi:hypothetical protein
VRFPSSYRPLLLFAMTLSVTYFVFFSSAFAFENNVICELKHNDVIIDRVSFAGEPSDSKVQVTGNVVRSTNSLPLCYLKFPSASELLSEMSCQPLGIRSHVYDIVENGYTRQLVIRIAPEPSVKVERRGPGFYSRRDIVIQGDPRSFEMVLFNDVSAPTTRFEYLKWRLGAKFEPMTGRPYKFETEGQYTVSLAPVGEPLSISKNQISLEITSKDGRYRIRCSN